MIFGSRPTSDNVGQRRQCHHWVGHGRKCGGSRWNFADISFNSRDTEYFRFTVRHFEFRLSADFARTQAMRQVVSVKICSQSAWIAYFHRLFLLRKSWNWISRELGKFPNPRPDIRSWPQRTEVDIDMISTVFERAGGLQQCHQKSSTWLICKYPSFDENRAGGNLPPRCRYKG